MEGEWRDLKEIPLKDGSGEKLYVFSALELERGERMEELRHCLTTQGFFYIKDYGLSEADHAQPTNAALQFFTTATPEEKARVTTTISAVRRGFSSLGSESTAKVTNSGNYSDYVMKYSMGSFNNVFPNQTFQDAFTHYYTTITTVSRHIVALILRCLGSSSVVPAKLDSLYRFLYYPDLPADRAAEREKLRMAAHYDVSIVTLIHQTACANGFVSLQYEINGKFVDVPTVRNTMLVQNGAIMTLLTEGKVKVPRHRVIAPPSALLNGSARTSSVFFMRPDFEFPVDLKLLRESGFDVLAVQGDRTTLGHWLGVNHVQHQINQQKL